MNLNKLLRHHSTARLVLRDVLPVGDSARRLEVAMSRGLGNSAAGSMRSAWTLPFSTGAAQATVRTTGAGLFEATDKTSAGGMNHSFDDQLGRHRSATRVPTYFLGIRLRPASILLPARLHLSSETRRHD
jgi:hypothetical protein